MFKFLIQYKLTSFLNYDIILSIIDKYGTEDNRERSEEYELKLEEYIKKHKISEFAEIIEPDLLQRSFDARVKMVLKIDVEKCAELANLCDLKLALADALKLNSSALFLYNIRDGCVVVTFLIPVSTADSVFYENKEFTTKQLEQFSTFSLQWLECGDFQWFNLKVSYL